LEWKEAWLIQMQVAAPLMACCAEDVCSCGAARAWDAARALDAAVGDHEKVPQDTSSAVYLHFLAMAAAAAVAALAAVASGHAHGAAADPCVHVNGDGLAHEQQTAQELACVQPCVQLVEHE
jgi:hypothetical protein